MKPNRVVAAIAAASAFLLATPALATDKVPSKQRARHYFKHAFPPVAPQALLQDKRGRVYRTARLVVVPKARCDRSKVQVECVFRAWLRPTRGAPASYGRVRCDGALWGKLRDGRMIGRVGDYKCVPA